MIEKRTRNGNARRDRRGDGDEVSPAEPATDRSAAPKLARRGGTLLVLLLLAAAAAALGYRYWGFWQTSETAPAAPPPPTVTVAKPMVKELVEWKDFTGQFQAVMEIA